MGIYVNDNVQGDNYILGLFVDISTTLCIDVVTSTVGTAWSSMR